MVEGDGTSSGEVKFLDIGGNTDGEGSHLGQLLTLRHESVGSDTD